MLFHVTTDISNPHDLNPNVRSRLVAEERGRALQRHAPRLAVVTAAVPVHAHRGHSARRAPSKSTS